MEENKVYIIQELPGTRSGKPKFNIMGAQKYGKLITLLPEFSQIILSPGPLILPLSYNIDILSISTFDLPVPISMKYANTSLFQDFSNAVI